MQFPAQTVRATVIGAGAHTLSLSGSTIWLEDVQLPLRPAGESRRMTYTSGERTAAGAPSDLDLETGSTCWRFPSRFRLRCAALLTVINADGFVARYPQSTSPAGGGRAGFW